MRVVFADAGYWIALLNPTDDLHSNARRLAQSIQPAYVVTSDAILTEVLNHFSNQGERFRSIACDLVDNLRTRKNVTAIEQTQAQFDSASHYTSSASIRGGVIPIVSLFRL